MSEVTLSLDDVFPGAQRLDRALASSLLLPREAHTIRMIMRHLVVANAAMRDSASQEDDQGGVRATAVLRSLLDSCLFEMARFGQCPGADATGDGRVTDHPALAAPPSRQD